MKAPPPSWSTDRETWFNLPPQICSPTCRKRGLNNPSGSSNLWSWVAIQEKVFRRNWLDTKENLSTSTGKVGISEIFGGAGEGKIGVRNFLCTVHIFLCREIFFGLPLISFPQSHFHIISIVGCSHKKKSNNKTIKKIIFHILFCINTVLLYNRSKTFLYFSLLLFIYFCNSSW